MIEILGKFSVALRRKRRKERLGPLDVPNTKTCRACALVRTKGYKKEKPQLV